MVKVVEEHLRNSCERGMAKILCGKSQRDEDSALSGQKIRHFF